MKTIDEAPFLDIFSPEFQSDPATVIDNLRPRSWLARTPIGGLVIGRSQVHALLADRRLRSSLLDLLRLQGVNDGPIHERMLHSLMATEGDNHTRLRKLVSRAFTPRAVDHHRPAMRQTLDTLLAPLLALGRCEFVADIADHYPIQVMCRLLGVPMVDHEDFARWNRAITWVLSLDLGSHRQEAEWGLTQMTSYVDRLVADRSQHPGQDLISALVQVSEEGDRLSDGELTSMIIGLLFA
ncbi:MAG: cytochrome P450 family protein, partial [Acidimicrobiales bacterium]